MVLLDSPYNCSSIIPQTSLTNLGALFSLLTCAHEHPEVDEPTRAVSLPNVDELSDTVEGRNPVSSPVEVGSLSSS